MPQNDDLQLYLDTQTTLPSEAKADVWDAYHGSVDQQDFKGRFDRLRVPQDVKADLWDMKWSNKHPLLMRQTGDILGNQPHVKVPSLQERQQAFTRGYLPARAEAQANEQRETDQTQRDAQAWKEKTEAWETQARYGLEYAPPTPSEIRRADEEAYQPVRQGAGAVARATPGLFSLDSRTQMASREQLYGGLHSMFRGGMTFAEPAMYAAAGANPMGALEAVAGAEAGSWAGSKISQAVGGSPAAQDLSGDLGTLVGGSVGFLRGGTRLGREGFDYLRGRRYAEQLRQTGLPESEVLTRTANPPWEQQQADIDYVAHEMYARPYAILDTWHQGQVDAIVRQRKVRANQNPDWEPYVPGDFAEKARSAGNFPVDQSGGFLPPPETPFAQQDFATPEEKGLNQQSTSSLFPASSYLDSGAETPLERVDRVMGEGQQIDSLEADLRKQDFMGTAGDTSFSDYDKAMLSQMDEVFKKQPAPPSITPDDLHASPEGQNAVPLELRASTLLTNDMLSRESKLGADEKAQTPTTSSEPRQPGERAATEPQTTPPNQAPGLSKEAKSSLLMAQQLERLARRQGTYSAIEPLRSAIKAHNLPKIEDALYLYNKALKSYLSGIKRGDKFALKTAIDIATMKGGADPTQLSSFPRHMIEGIWSWTTKNFPRDDPDYRNLMSTLSQDTLRSAQESIEEINPHFNKALTLDGWAFGSPENGLTLSMTYRGEGIKTRVGERTFDAHPTMSVPLSIAMHPEMLHNFTAEFLKNFGLKFPRFEDLAGPKSKGAAAGADVRSVYMGMAFTPVDVLEAGLKGIRNGAKFLLDQARSRGVLEPAQGLSAKAKAQGVLRENVGALFQDKEQLYAKFNKPEVNPKSLPIGQRTWEQAKAKVFSHFGAKSILETAVSRWDAATPAQFKAWTKAMESGRYDQMSGPDQSIAQQLHTMLEDRWDQVEAINPNAADSWIANYFPHIWENPAKAGDFAQRVLGQRRPLQGPRSFLKERFYGTIEEGMDAGLVPSTYNPIKMGLVRLHEMDRYIMAHNIKDSLQGQGLASFVRPGEQLGPDWAKLNDRIFDAYRRGDDKVLNYYGSWYAPQEVAKVINNYLSPGLRNSTIKGFRAYDIVRSYGNILNQAQLGLSPFHLFFTSMDSMLSTFAHGMNLMEQGQSLKGLGKMLRTPAAPIETWLRGNKLMAEYLNPGTYADYSHLANMVSMADGRIAMDPFYKNHTVDAFWKSFHKGVDEFRQANYKSASMSGVATLARLPFAGVEMMAKPIMEWTVPRMKLGIFADMASRLHEQFTEGSIDNQTFRKALNDAWDSVDNRMGQLVYDNLGWHRMLKDMLMLTIRSVGWNVGTFRELGGGIIKDPLTKGLQAIAGENPKLVGKDSVGNIRMNYALSLGLVTAAVGGMINYVYTGNMPHGVDYYAPQTGRLDESGKPERVMFPGYQRDIISFAHAPVSTVLNKLHPWLQQSQELYHNEDFWGREIVHSDDPFLQRSAQVAKYVVGNFKPLSAQAYTERRKLGASAGEAASTYGLLLPAPKHIGQSAGEQYFYDIARAHMERGPKTTSNWESMQNIRDLRNRAAQDMRQSGNSMPSEKIMNDIAEQVTKGQLSSHAANNLLRQAQYTPLQRYVEHATIDEAIEGWHRLQPNEKASVAELILRKANSINNAPPERQAYLTEQLHRIASEYPQIVQQLYSEQHPNEPNVTKPDN